MGNPIAHSKSPFIHARFAAQTDQAIEYRTILVQPGGLERAISEFHAAGGKGLNITLPFKGEAFALAATRTSRAERAGAANTLWFDDADRICADNTDGAGLTRDLVANHGVVLKGRRILLLGAGGAARGVLGPLLDEAPTHIVVANRTPERGRDLARMFESAPVEACAYDDLGHRRFDIVINATSASLEGAVPPISAGALATGAVCYDMMYGDAPTAFVRWGTNAGAAQSLDGLGMLVEQAAESFLRWRGVRPDTAPVIAALRTAWPTKGPEKTRISQQDNGT